MSAEIEARENGPYLVRNLKSLKNSKDAELSSDQDTIALCRCGESQNKPYCDGTHKRIGFSSAVDNPKEGKWQDYVGKDITIHDNRRLCAHAGECTSRLASVWRMGEKPWIDPDGAAVDAIIEVIGKCPSGALSYSIDGQHAGEDGADECISICANGPYQVTGSIALNDPSRDADAPTGKYTLCRCGASKNKPFCDGSHWEIEFTDEGV